MRCDDIQYNHQMQIIHLMALGSSNQSWSKVEESESSLSRSMRYAEPWLYGSVRAPSGLLFTPALVLCSCSDYLNGTKRSSKKTQTICKKCKATRIPLNGVESSRFGTVRCYPTTPAQQTSVRAGTVKVSSKSRPSILTPSGDPYDLVRRSRLTVPETVGQYRARSVSPNKNRGGEGRSSSTTRAKSNTTALKYSTIGRKSILECNVNPYELMSTNGDTQDASITFVNGQRIRVRPKLPENDYEDIQIRGRQTSRRFNHQNQYSANKTKNSLQQISSPKTSTRNEKESDCNNRFKSILKKPTTTFSDTDSTRIGPEQRSPSPTRKSGSHFYLPLPVNNTTPRKKVQFFVENELVLRQHENCNKKESSTVVITNDIDNDYETDDVFVEVENGRETEMGDNGIDKRKKSIPIQKEEKMVKENVDVDYEDLNYMDIDSPANSCHLRRTKSERMTQEAARVLFHDTMALRNRFARNDSRDMFTQKDLEKLDGVDAAKLKGFEKIRPRGPPPQPPTTPVTPTTTNKSSPISDIRKTTNMTKLAPLASPESVTIIQDTKNIEKTRNIEITPNSNILPPLIFIEGVKKNKSLDKENVLKQRSQDIKNTSVESKKDVQKVKNESVLEMKAIPSDTKDEITENVRVNEKVLTIFEDSAHQKVMEKNNVEVIKDKPKKFQNNMRENVPVFDRKDKFSTEETLQVKDNIDNNYQTINEIITANTFELSEPDKANIVNTEAPLAPPRKRSNGKQPNCTKKNSITINSPVFVNETPNKTIVKISSPLNSPVHKLKIKNEFAENSTTSVTISENNLGKTSIMINGDDCYCTVNIKDDISLYQSSVVVKDSGILIQSPERKSSSIYITGNFEKAPSFESEEKNKKGIRNIVEEKVENSCNHEDSLTNFGDTKEENVKINTIDPNTCTTEMLKQLLSDPVEAVRRNLVPHVCGKSDVSRRPRGRKLIESDDLVANFLNDSLLNNKSSNHVSQLIEESFHKLRNYDNGLDDDKDVASEHSSSTQYEIMDPGSDCYTDNSNRSSVTEEELSTRSKFYELLAESAVEVSENDDHHYESIKANVDPIYEEIEIPPPLPANPPPAIILDDLQLDKEYTTRSIFEGASKYDILSYLVDAKERGIVPEDSYTYNFNNSGIAVEEDGKETSESYNRVSHMSTVSDSSEESSLVLSNALIEDKLQRSNEVERNDSGVGSETSKSSLSKYRTKQELNLNCEDCDGTVDMPGENEPLICRKCLKKRSERKEIITEIVETEEKYSRDLQIILEEFYQPMLVAGLLTSDQLSAIFLNVEELLENSQALAERLRDAVEIAIDQGDEDLLTVNIGKLILEAAPMLHAFETYCVRQGAASLLLASLEKEKELLRIFLRVSQMENTVLRRMNLNSFLMVPVQRVTKYPLLLARLYKVTSVHHETREQLKEAQHKIELHLNHMNSETKDVPSKLWRRISSNNGRRSSSEMDLVNIKLRKIAVDVLEWNHDEARFALEGKLLFTQPTDNNWRKGRTIKLTPVNALLVTNGKVTNSTSRPDPTEDGLIFSRHSGVREAALLLVRDKNGRYSLLREPLYLDRCVIAADPAWQSYFEVQELLGKDTFIFKADDEDQTKIWYRHLQYYAQGMGAWRKRRNALANIMINGMGLRS